MSAKQREAAPPQFNAGDEEQVAERKKLSATQEAQRIEGLRKIVNDPDSRLWLRDLLGFCGIGRSSFTGNSQTFFLEGQRNVGLRVQGELVKHYPDAFITMLKEGA